MLGNLGIIQSIEKSIKTEMKNYLQIPLITYNASFFSAAQSIRSHLPSEHAIKTRVNILLIQSKDPFNSYFTLFLIFRKQSEKFVGIITKMALWLEWELPGEMAQQLRVLLLFWRAGLDSQLTWQLIIFCDPSSRGS